MASSRSSLPPCVERLRRNDDQLLQKPFSPTYMTYRTIQPSFKFLVAEIAFILMSGVEGAANAVATAGTVRRIESTGEWQVTGRDPVTCTTLRRHREVGGSSQLEGQVNFRNQYVCLGWGPHRACWQPS